MARGYDASNDGMKQSGITDGGFTIMGWFYLETDKNDVTALMQINDNQAVRTDTDGQTLVLWDGVTGTPGGSPMVTGTYYHIALTCTDVNNIAGTTTLYRDGVSIATGHGNSIVSGSMRIGNSADDSPEYLHGRSAYLKAWSEELSEEQVNIERNRVSPLFSFNSLYGWWHNTNEDYSGQENDFSAHGGSMTDEDDPGIPWGGHQAEFGEELIEKDTAWGHDTDVTQDNIRDFLWNWTGTGEVSGSGDAEVICLNNPGEYMNSEVVHTGAYTVTLHQNYYNETGDDVVLNCRHGATEAACLAASWVGYTGSFTSLGYVQVQLMSTL